MAYNILVVDDEQSIADLIELYLQNENYHIFKNPYLHSEPVNSIIDVR